MNLIKTFNALNFVFKIIQFIKNFENYKKTRESNLSIYNFINQKSNENYFQISCECRLLQKIILFLTSRNVDTKKKVNQTLTDKFDWIGVNVENSDYERL